MGGGTGPQGAGNLGQLANPQMRDPMQNMNQGGLPGAMRPPQPPGRPPAQGIGVPGQQGPFQGKTMEMQVPPGWQPGQGAAKQQPFQFNPNYDKSQPTGPGNWRRLPTTPQQGPTAPPPGGAEGAFNMANRPYDRLQSTLAQFSTMPGMNDPNRLQMMGPTQPGQPAQRALNPLQQISQAGMLNPAGGSAQLQGGQIQPGGGAPGK